jgi:hypothetical protein
LLFFTFFVAVGGGGGRCAFRDTARRGGDVMETAAQEANAPTTKTTKVVSDNAPVGSAAPATAKRAKVSGKRKKKRANDDGPRKKQKTSGKTPTTSKTMEKWTAGDWACKCGFHNYRKNLKCHRCKTDKPAKLGRKGAWEYLTRWSVMEVDEVDEVHHAWLISQSGIGNEMSDEFFDLFLPYCEGLEDARKKVALKGALKAQARLQQIIEALGGGDKKSDDSEEDSGSDSDGEEKVTAVAAAVAKKPTKRRGKRGRGKGGGGATAPTKNPRTV